MRFILSEHKNVRPPYSQHLRTIGVLEHARYHSPARAVAEMIISMFTRLTIFIFAVDWCRRVGRALSANVSVQLRRFKSNYEVFSAVRNEAKL